jgi:long-subunit fatty acid transport protein
VLLMPVDELRIGVSFQPPYSLDGKGEVHLSGELAGEYMESFGGLVNDNSPLYLKGVDEDMMLTTNLPAILRWGVLVQPNAHFNIGLDAQVEFWQRAKSIDATEVDVPLEACDENGENCQPLLDEISGRFDSMDVCETGLIDCSALETYKGPDGDGAFHIAQNYRNSIGLKLGGEVRPIPSHPEHFAIRFGYGFETSAIPDETISLTIYESMKHTAAVGVSGMWRGFQVHFSYAHIFYHERVISEDTGTEVTTGLEGTATNKIDAGTYNAGADILGLSLTFDFTGMHQVAQEKKAARARASAMTVAENDSEARQ